MHSDTVLVSYSGSSDLHDSTTSPRSERVPTSRNGWTESECLESVYLDTDPILATLKDDDWLASEVDLDAIADPQTSVSTTIEVQYVLEDTWSRDRLVDVHEAIEALGIELLDLTPAAIDAGAELRRRYPRLNLFDAVHLGTARTIDEPIVSTDSLYPDVEEVEHVDPRSID